MATAYETGVLWETFGGVQQFPAGQRSYYEQVLLDTLRTKAILVPYCMVKEDFAARDTGIIIFSEVFDTAPNWNALAETDIWLPGTRIDSRSVQIALEIHGDVIKLSDYHELTNFWANGDLRGLCRGKLGLNMVEHLDYLSRAAFLSSAYKDYANDKTGRYDLLQTDVFDPDLAELVRVHLEEREIPGVAVTGDGDGITIVCTTTPRVCHDIRIAAGSKWLEVIEYAGSVRKFNSEVGSWGSVRFVKTNRLHMKNYGTASVQTTLDGGTNAGAGATAGLVDGVYTVGQGVENAFVLVTSKANFSVGDYVTIHDDGNSGDDGVGGFPPIEGDGTQETRRIVAIDAGANKLSFDRPLLKPHLTGDYVTKGVDVHASIFHGGPSVVYGVGERPHPLVLPKIDDLGMVQRFSWRGFLKFQPFRPEFIEVIESGGSVN